MQLYESSWAATGQYIFIFFPYVVLHTFQIKFQEKKWPYFTTNGKIITGSVLTEHEIEI
jgi:hypothetical protein